MNNKNLVTLFALLLTCTLFAGGFRVSLQGVRQAAMAHTSAHTKDASVIFFNPAGMSFIEEKLSIAGGVFGTMINSEYQDNSMHYTHKTDNPTSTPGYLGIAYKIKDKFSLGLSVTTPYGNTIDWGDNWNGSTLVQNIELKAFFIQPSVSVKFADWFSAGFGFIFANGSVTLNKSISNLGGVTLESKKGKGTGFNLGAIFKPSDKFMLSLAYRSIVNMKVENGDATFNVPPALIGSAPFYTKNDTFDATLPLASEFTAGLSYKIKPNLTLAADINVSGWQAYQKLVFDFGQNLVGNTPTDLTISSTPKYFKYTSTYRIGGEYVTAKNLAIRLGYYYDESPVQSEYFSPETPSTNNNYITAGLGYQFKNKLSLDLFGSGLISEVYKFNNFDQNFKGQIRNRGFILGFGITYNH